MTEGKALILATKPFAKEVRAKSWAYSLSTFLVVIAAHSCIWLFSFSLILQIIFSIIAGLSIVRLFVIYHDYMHHSILRKSKLANVLFTIFGLYILTPKSVWKRTHDYHHNHNSKLHTSSIGSYPIVTKEKFLAAGKLEQRIYLLIRHPISFIFAYFFAFLYGICIRSFLSSPKRHSDSFVSMALHLGISICLITVFGWLTFFMTYLLPMMFAQGLGSYLFYAQHNFPGVTFKDKDGWTYINAAMNSSSHMKMNRVMNWFTANIGYHHIHHINHRIPFYRLPEVYQKIPALQNAKTTSLNPLEIFRCFQLKVWDPQLGRMINKQEIYQ